jgi:hypothetical protein
VSGRTSARESIEKSAVRVKRALEEAQQALAALFCTTSSNSMAQVSRQPQQAAAKVHADCDASLASSEPLAPLLRLF